MGDANKHARKVLLRRYEAQCMALKDASTKRLVLISSGRLMEVAEILKECRHRGDDPDLAGWEWICDAGARIQIALSKVGASTEQDADDDITDTYTEQNWRCRRA